MKTIEIEAKEYEVDDWIHWVAQDEDGEWWGFEEKPHIVHRNNWWKTNKGDTTYIFDGSKSSDWKTTLSKV